MVLGIGWLFSNFPNRILKVGGIVGATFLGLRAIKPHAFKFMCNRAFEKIDLDHNNLLDYQELQLAIYELYNLMNKRLPGWSDPPNRLEILEAISKYDVDGNNKLDKDEFHEFAKSFVTKGDSFFKRISVDGAVNTTVLPIAAPLAKQALGLGMIPDSVAASLLSTAGKIGKAINPLTLGVGPSSAPKV